MKRYLIVADDFTGANDTGVQLCRRGIRTDVFLAPPETQDKSASVVLDSESRGMEPEQAYRAVKELIGGIDLSGFDLVIKKVDSTLRGNIPWELKAVDEAVGSDIVVFAPALPDLGRTTEGAVQKLHGTPISQTELARDPKKPVTQDNIAAMLRQAYDEPVSHITLEQLRAGKASFAEGRLFACDAVTNRDMQAIIAAAIESGRSVLWVGTAGIADNLLETAQRSRPALGVVASLSSVTRGQLQHAEQAGVRIVQVPVHRLLEESGVLEACLEQAAASLEEGRDTILATSSSCDAAEFERSEQAAARLGKRTEEVSAFTQEQMGLLACRVLERCPVSGVFLTGGDTAMGFFERAGAKGTTILAEVMVGIPLMELRGGGLDGLRLITKAGAFGREDAITYALRKLKEVTIQ